MLRIALSLAVVVVAGAACFHDPTRSTLIVADDEPPIAPSLRTPTAVLNPARSTPAPRESTSEGTARAAAAAEIDTTGPHPRFDRGGPAALSPGWYPVPAPAIELDPERRTADPWRDGPACVDAATGVEGRACAALRGD